MSETQSSTKTCSHCQLAHDAPGRYCRSCHAAYMRNWRKTHPLTPEEKRKDSCRSMSSYYLKIGKLTRTDCKDCDSPDTEMHHPDYGQPLLVVFLCRPCHLARHAA